MRDQHLIAADVLRKAVMACDADEVAVVRVLYMAMLIALSVGGETLEQAMLAKFQSGQYANDLAEAKKALDELRGGVGAAGHA
jgi:hypothetical protein